LRKRLRRCIVAENHPREDRRISLKLAEFARTVRVSDGAWGTTLQALGLEAGAPPELWNQQKPSAVEQVAREYVEAGSDVILTNTFGGSRLALAPHGAAGRATDLVTAGAKLSRNAAGNDVKVFGSIGPTGKIVMMDEVPREELFAAFAETAVALQAGGVDAIVLETFNELTEAELALDAVRKATPELPVIVCMTFASGPENTATLMGETPADLAAMAQAHGASGVGANCGTGPDNYVKVAPLLREATSLPVWIKPNAGLPQVDAQGRTRFPMGPEDFAGYVGDLLAAGANFLGGCCGTTPEHIRAIRAAVDRAGA